MLKHIIISHFGISDQFSYLAQEFMLKNDTLKNGTSCIGLYGSAPPRASSSRQDCRSRSKRATVCDCYCAGILFIKEKQYTLLRRGSALRTEYPGSEHGAKCHARSNVVKQLNAFAEESGNNNRRNS